MQLLGFILWFLSKSQYDSRTQTEGLSSYWYKLNTTSCQADCYSQLTIMFNVDNKGIILNVTITK
jgi:hypothetical protein